MKNLLIIFCLSGFSGFAFGQVDTILGDNYLFEEVYQCADQTKDQIYEKSKTWVKRTLKSGDNLIEFDDEEKNSIIVSGNILLPQVKRPMVNNRIVNFKLSIFFKDSRIKYVLDNIVYSCDIPSDLGITHHSQPINNLDFAPFLNKGKLKELALTDTDMELRKLLLNYKSSLTSNQTAEQGDW